MKKLIILGIVILLTLSACSSKPDDVSEELWDKSIQYTIYIDKLTQEGETLPDGLGEELNDLITNDTERDIVVNIHTLSLNSTLYSYANILGNNIEETEKSYNEAYAKLEKVLGASNLKESNLDINLVENYITENQLGYEKELEEASAEFMKDTGVRLKGKEVQYDMANNLDTDFYLEGTVELCDYYNYGYTNEEKYFCGEITPTDGNYSDSWYLYFHRESFDSIYDTLLTGSIDLMVVAKIPSTSYESGQGNMAKVQSLKVY